MRTVSGFFTESGIEVPVPEILDEVKPLYTFTRVSRTGADDPELPGVYDLTYTFDEATAEERGYRIHNGELTDLNVTVKPREGLVTTDTIKSMTYDGKSHTPDEFVTGISFEDVTDGSAEVTPAITLDDISFSFHDGTVENAGTYVIKPALNEALFATGGILQYYTPDSIRFTPSPAHAVIDPCDRDIYAIPKPVTYDGNAHDFYDFFAPLSDDPNDIVGYIDLSGQVHSVYAMTVSMTDPEGTLLMDGATEIGKYYVTHGSVIPECDMDRNFNFHSTTFEVEIVAP